MRILLCSNWFAPSIGGVETVSKILAEEWTRNGHTVTIVTGTPGPEFVGPYKVIRNPSRAELRKLGDEADIIHQNLMSLRTLLPLILCRKPIVMTHQSWLRRNDGSRGLENYMKLLALRVATNVSISKAIAAELPVQSTVIGNPFEAKEFETLRDRSRTRDIVFLGRLVSDKGCDLLVKAVGLLKQRGHAPTVTMIGDGPEMAALKTLAAEQGVAEQFEFLGSVREGRGEIVAQHRVMAVPSLWAEPFGIVACEGIASGCAVVASEKGGLMEAVGPCGLPFPNGNFQALADALERALYEPGLREKLVANGPEHLKNFQGSHVAALYIDLFRTLLPR